MIEKTLTTFKQQTNAIRKSLAGVQFCLMLAGVQSGKTTGGSIWELRQIQRKPAGTHLITAPTYKHLQQATLLKFNASLPPGWATFNKSDMAYDTAWGGKIFCRSMDDPDSIEGITADSVWADECGLFSQRAIENIQSRLSATEGPFMGTSTPYATGALKSMIYDKWKAGLPEYHVEHWTSKDNPHFSENSWNRAKRDLPVKTFQRLYEALWASLEGLLFEDYDDNRHNTLLPVVPASWQRIGGIDFGYSEGHPFAAGIWASPNFNDTRRKMFKVFEYKRHGQTLADHKKVLDEAQRGFAGKVPIWYADSAGAQEIAELRKLGMNVSPARKDVDLGITHVQSLMRNDRYRLVEGRTEQTKHELSIYRRDHRFKIVKELDDLLDADRYALYTHMKFEPQAVQIL